MKALLILLLCLIVLPVLAYSSQFSLEVFATAGTEDLDAEDEGGEEDGDSEDNGGSSDEQSSGSAGLARSDDGDSEDNGGSSDEAYTSEGLAGPDDGDSEILSEESGGLAGPDDGDDDSSGGLAPADEVSRGSDGNGDSGDDGSDGDRFRHNAEEIAMELTSLSPEEIKEYPITDLSDKDITLVFRFLNPGNLAKVLLNIPQEDLAEIQDRLTPAAFNESLSRISEVDRTQVVNRLVFTSIN